MKKLCQILTLEECYFAILPAKDRDQATIIAYEALFRARKYEQRERYVDLYSELFKYLLPKDFEKELLSIVDYNQTDTLKVIRDKNKKIEKLIIEATLSSNKGNVSQTAAQLNVHRKTVYRKMGMLNIRRIKCDSRKVTSAA